MRILHSVTLTLCLVVQSSKASGDSTCVSNLLALNNVVSENLSASDCRVSDVIATAYNSFVDQF